VVPTFLSGAARRSFSRAHHSLKPLAVAVLIMVGGVGCGGATSSAGSNTPAVVSVSSVTFKGSAGFFTDDVANQEGFFKQEGLNVTFLQTSNGAQYLQFMISGSVQGGITDLGPALTTIGKGADIKVLGATVDKNVFELTAAKGQTWANGLTDWRQIMQALVGRTVGVSGLGAATDIALRGMLIAAGVQPTQVHILGVGTQAAAGTQMKIGNVQAVVEEFSNEPYFAEQGVGQPLLKFADAPVDTVANVSIGLIFNGKWYASNKAVANRWLKAEQLAEKWIEDPANTTKAAALMADWVNVDQSAGLADLTGIRQLYKATPADFHVPRQNITNELQLLNEEGILPKSQNPSYDSFVVAPSTK